MISYTVLYGLFALTSVLLFNALVLCARYVQQAKEPPKDEDFEELMQQKKALQNQVEQRNHEIVELLSRVKQLEDAQKKLDEGLKSKQLELDALKEIQKKEEDAENAASA